MLEIERPKIECVDMSESFFASNKAITCRLITGIIGDI